MYSKVTNFKRKIHYLFEHKIILYKFQIIKEYVKQCYTNFKKRYFTFLVTVTFLGAWGVVLSTLRVVSTVRVATSFVTCKRHHHKQVSHRYYVIYEYGWLPHSSIMSYIYVTTSFVTGTLHHAIAMYVIEKCFMCKREITSFVSKQLHHR